MIKSLNTLITLVLVVILSACKEQKKETETVKKMDLTETITEQYNKAYPEVNKHIEDKKFIPRAIKEDSTKFVGVYDWTSAFYPGTLWHLYKITGDEKWKERATLYTEKLDTIQYWQDNHDVGFMIECSFGNGIKYGNKNYEDVIVQAAKSLSTRFNKNTGVIKSWEWSKKWEYPVIIDNMMNLELLFNATKISGDSTYYNIAITHANTTMKNHFRDNFSSYHVVDYNPKNGKIIKKNTHQGISDDSAWARGQAWGLYGFTMCYKETHNEAYLNQAKNIAAFIKNNPNLPQDKIPYWDYNAPAGNNTPRDASAAAITASALYDLATYVDQNEANEYISFADEIMTSLTSQAYLAKIGTNSGFMLMHSVGSKPHGEEVDSPLNYADYYFTEALIRKNK